MGMVPQTLRGRLHQKESRFFFGVPKTLRGSYIRKSQDFFSPDKNSFLNSVWEKWIVKCYLCIFKTNEIRIDSELSCKQFRNISLLQQRAAGTLNEMKLLHCSGKISLLSSFCIHCCFLKPCLSTWRSILFEYPLSRGWEDVLYFQIDYSIYSFSTHPHWLSLRIHTASLGNTQSPPFPLRLTLSTSRSEHWLAILLLLGQHTFKISWWFESNLHTEYEGK